MNDTVYNPSKKRAQQNGMTSYVFHDPDSNMINADKRRKAFRKEVKESGIAHFRFHDLRHYIRYAACSGAGVDLYKVSKLR